MREYSPLFKLSDKMINLLTQISEEVGRVGVLFEGRINSKAKACMIKKVYTLLSLEDCSLLPEYIEDIIRGEKIAKDYKESTLAKNLFEVYEMSAKINPCSVNDMLFAYKMLLGSIDTLSYEFREDRKSGGALFEANSIPSRFVPGAIRDVFEWYKRRELHPLIRSAVLYFELEFLKPFKEHNGIVSRLWFDMLLCRWKDIFLLICVHDNLIKRRDEYREVLYDAYKTGECNRFVELMLETVYEALKNADIPKAGSKVAEPKSINKSYKNEDMDEIVTVKATSSFTNKLLEVMGDEVLSTNEIMLRLGMTHKPTFRKNYLNPAIELGLVEMTLPGKPRSRHQRYKKIS